MNISRSYNTKKSSILIQWEGYDIRCKIPKNVFEQQDLYNLMAMYANRPDKSLWTQIREIILQNVEVSKGTQSIEIANVSLELLNEILNGYITKLFIPFFTTPSSSTPKIAETETEALTE